MRMKYVRMRAGQQTALHDADKDLLKRAASRASTKVRQSEVTTKVNRVVLSRCGAGIEARHEGEEDWLSRSTVAG